MLSSSLVHKAVCKETFQYFVFVFLVSKQLLFDSLVYLEQNTKDWKQI